MSEVDEKLLTQRLEAMVTKWRALRRLHERHASSPGEALLEDPSMAELRRNLEEAMMTFSRGALEWVEEGHAIRWEADAEVATGNDVSGHTVATAPSPQRIAEEIDERLEEFSAPLLFETTTDVVDEMQRLEEWTSEDTLERMEVWPDRGRVLTIEHIAARARTLQDLPSDRLALVDIGRITVMFGRMAEHLKQGWPGRAHGLARAHTPRSYSWEQDAHDLYEELSIWRQRSDEISEL